MTLFDPGPSGKRCFAYCGDDVCDCECAPRYRGTLKDFIPDRSTHPTWHEKEPETTIPHLAVKKKATA